jgi:hypothetical protein
MRPLLPLLLAGLIAGTAVAEASGGPLARECESRGAEWIWCDDFEIDRSPDYFEGRVLRVAGAGVDGSTAAAFEFTAGKPHGGGIKIAFGRTPTPYMRPVDDGAADYREIYWRLFVRVPADWVGNGADKLSRAMILADANWAQAMIAHVWSGPDPGPKSAYLLLDPASGTDESGILRATKYSDAEHLRWLGQRYGSFPIFARENFGDWHCVEAQVRLNGAGARDGVFRLFINDRLEAESTTLNWVGSYDEYGINAVFFESYWNQGSPVTQTRYFDNLVISTDRIGCARATDR